MPNNNWFLLGKAIYIASFVTKYGTDDLDFAQDCWAVTWRVL